MANDVSRGIKVKELNDRWKNGPDFLKLPEEEWPQEAASPVRQDLRADNKERRKVKIVCQVTTSKAEEAINLQKFSRWRKLIRVTAQIKRLSRKTREKRQAESRDDDRSPAPKVRSRHWNSKKPKSSGLKKHRKVYMTVEQKGNSKHSVHSYRRK